MPYIDKSFYDDEYMGLPIPDIEEFKRLSKRASEIIDQMTNYTIKNYEFTRMAEFIQEQVKKATAAQTEFLALNGEEVNHGDSTTSMSIGKFSISEGNRDSQLIGRNPKRTSPAVIQYLVPTGLIYAGVDVE
ncbi:hypothetical protein [Halobacillus sp. Cin3]|uniref:hypothetical protein n=1 Tax=Halobacillus sp. Cin3 TaxID=2928441 RepID=UPI00248DEB5D|nr:hypothetical protein [Halobacillus sp. Cin3]